MADSNAQPLTVPSNGERDSSDPSTAQEVPAPGSQPSQVLQNQVDNKSPKNIEQDASPQFDVADAVLGDEGPRLLAISVRKVLASMGVGTGGCVKPVAVRDWPMGCGPKKKEVQPENRTLQNDRTALDDGQVQNKGQGQVLNDGVVLRPVAKKGIRVKENSKVLVVQPLQMIQGKHTESADVLFGSPRPSKTGLPSSVKKKKQTEGCEGGVGTSTGKKRKKNEEDGEKRRLSTSLRALDSFEVADGGDGYVGDPRQAVCRALRIYDALRRKFLRDDESASKERVAGTIKRPDLKAGTFMKDRNQWLNRKKYIGAVPGVEVGDHFYFRMEMCIIGLHRQVQAGIDFIGAKESGYDVPVAASIIASGGYEDDIDTGETLVYTGQGGNNYKGDKRQKEDQKLERGNLALSKSCEKDLPVRVIRGCKDKNSPTGTIYTYDGLYKVEKHWLERGVAGFGVYKYKLIRLPDQPELGSTMVKFSGNLKSKSERREALIMADISDGKEPVPICVVNDVDQPPEGPPPFEYISRVMYTERFPKPILSEGCDCKGGCKDSNICVCLAKNSSRLPYTHGGILADVQSVVYECGDMCKCPPSCHTRVSQHGIKYQLEVFKTKDKGWGVRSWDYIPNGSFVCEYVGEFIDNEEAEKRVGNDEYLFDLDCLKGSKARGIDVSAFFNEPTKINVGQVVEGADHSIDAGKFGNVGRFINHSCAPNLFVQCVLYDHHDLKAPHIMLFAAENIPPLRELTYDYGYTVGGVTDSNGNVKTKVCHCGAITCTGRMY